MCCSLDFYWKEKEGDLISWAIMKSIQVAKNDPALILLNITMELLALGADRVFVDTITFYNQNIIQYWYFLAPPIFSTDFLAR